MSRKRGPRTMVRAIGLLALAGLFWMGFVWPPPSWWRTHWPAETAFQHMRARQLDSARDTTPRRYDPVPLDSITDWLERAATAGEDDGFFEHPGIDWRAVRSALGYRHETFAWSRPRDRAELQRVLGRAYERRAKLRGASTITQQLAKNLYLSPSRNPLRKVKEAVIAYRLEWVLDKPRILALYLNVAEFGPNLWGVEAASRHYFQRHAARISLDQAALLVATLPHPLTSNPSYRPGRTRWRQQYILRRLRGEPVEMPSEERDDDAVPTPPRDTLPAALPVVPADSLPGLPTDTATVPPAPDTVAVTRSR